MRCIIAYPLVETGGQGDIVFEVFTHARAQETL